MYSLFRCLLVIVIVLWQTVGDSSFLYMDTTTQCWESKHLQLLMLLGLPTFVVFIIGYITSPLLSHNTQHLPTSNPLHVLADRLPACLYYHNIRWAMSNVSPSLIDCSVFPS